MLLPSMLRALVDNALAEDLGSGDLTTEATVESETEARAHALARDPIVVCGGEVFTTVFLRVDTELRCECLVPDGVKVEPGTSLWRVEGRARSILGAERVALNFAQRMSGIATLTRQFVDAVPSNCSTRIVDTRKTTPGLRALERYAVRTGGGHNHRDNLSSAVLIKDNHIVAAGGIARAVREARLRAPHTTRIEVEVGNLDELAEALGSGADVVMLDNFTPADVQQAVQQARGKAVVEVSGRIGMERIAALARVGVDVISIGALTHSAPAADIALDLELG